MFARGLFFNDAKLESGGWESGIWLEPGSWEEKYTRENGEAL